MKTLLIILSIATFLLIFSTLVCGLWIRNSAEVVEESSITFHMNIGILTSVVTVATVIVALIRG